MSVVEKLMDGATADVDVLRSLAGQGDNFMQFREVDFLLRSPSQEKAELVAGFINDFQFGTATATEDSRDHSVKVMINMPVTQNVILSISGFMSCIAEIYGLEFDGWGCSAKTNT